jgi:nucleoside-diphosphate-sugar epimerase
MNQIDKSKPVLVTGATGYVAGWLVKRLLDEGLTVHAAVRDPDNKSKVEHLDKLAAASNGSINYFKADLLDEESYANAMHGCELVFHTASPFSTVVDDPQRDLIDPAVNGTVNVLTTAVNTPGIKRVVVTSSCAAIYTDAIDTRQAPGGMLTEDIWNTTASIDYQPYSYSKTLAEKKAWEIAGNQSEWDLVTINPSLVLGPPLNPHSNTSESLSILKQLGDGTMKMGAPRMGLGLVDVRDVAEAHFRAGFIPEAKGRYITSAHNTNFYEMSQTLLDKFGNEYPLPRKVLPKWMVMIFGPLTNKLFTWKWIRNNVDVPWKADNTKIKHDLKMTFRPMRETMEDSFQVLVDENIL